MEEKNIVKIDKQILQIWLNNLMCVKTKGTSLVRLAMVLQDLESIILNRYKDCIGDENGSTLNT